MSPGEGTPDAAAPGGGPDAPREERALGDGWAELQAQLRDWRAAISNAIPPWFSRALAATMVIVAILLPFVFSEASGFMDATIKSVALAVMALGLNVVVGFAGLLDLGYVAFYAIGAYCAGWFGSGFFFKYNVHVGISHMLSGGPGLHLNFAIVMILAAAICAIAGIIIGLPTLRLRGDYIAIVTLAFGEIIAVVAVNGQDIHFPPGLTLTAGNCGITPIDSIAPPGGVAFDPLNLRP